MTLLTDHATTIAPDAAPESEGGKARQILDGARAVFLADGFDGASMNDIARVAGVSKGTLYVYFPSKEALFEALVRHDRREQAEQLSRFATDTGDVDTVLRAFGRDLLAVMLTPACVAQVRTVIAVAPKFPDIGRAFHEAGPAHGIARLSGYLVAQAAAGALRPLRDPQLAAVQFVELCRAGIFARLLYCVDASIAADEMARVVDGAVDVFMSAYGPALKQA